MVRQRKGMQAKAVAGLDASDASLRFSNTNGLDTYAKLKDSMLIVAASANENPPRRSHWKKSIPLQDGGEGRLQG